MKIFNNTQFDFCSFREKAWQTTKITLQITELANNKHINLAIISVGIFNIVFHSRKMYAVKNSYSIISTIKHEIYPFSRTYHVDFDFHSLGFKNIECLLYSIARSANYGLPFTSTCKVYFIKTQSHSFIHTRVELLWLFSHQNTRVALLWQRTEACKAYNIYHLTLYKKMFTDPYSKGT